MLSNFGDSRKSYSLSILFGLCSFLILVGCGRTASNATIKYPVQLPVCTTSGALAGSIKMQTVASTVTANNDVVWEVTASGGTCGNYEITVVETGEVIRFKQKGIFTRRYTTLGARTEKIMLKSLNSSGAVFSGPISFESSYFTVVAQGGSGSGSPLVCDAVVSPYLLTFPTASSVQNTTALIEARRGSTRVNARVLGYYSYGAPVSPLDAVPTAFALSQSVRLSVLAPPYEGVLGLLFGVEEQGTGIVAQCAATIVVDHTAPPTPVPPSISLQAQIGSSVFYQFAAVQPGTSAVVSWNAVNSNSCSLYRDNALVLANAGSAGSYVTGGIYAASTFTARCTSPQGLMSERSFVFSLCTPPAIGRVDVKANGSDGPIHVDFGAAVTISYSATNVTSCNLSALSLSGASASAVRNLYANVNYTVSCTYPGGSTSDTVTVYVGAPTYQVLFVTEAVYTGDLGGAAGADAKCQAAADAAGVMPGRTFKAILPNGTTNPKDRIAIDRRVVNNCSGRPELASDARDFWDGNWDRAATCNENGVRVSGGSGFIPVWTSTSANGYRLASDCQGWTSSSYSKLGFVGDANDASCDHFFDGGNAAKRCDYSAHLFCISQ